MMFKNSLNSMINKVVVFLFFFIGLVYVTAQNDTIFYSDQWQVTSKESASFFRPPIKKQEDLFLVQDYFIHGGLQMEATSSSDTKDIWEGLATWYNEDGTLQQQGNYSKGMLDGEFITYYNNEKFVANYEKGFLVSGKMISQFARYKLYRKLENDTTLTIYFDKDLNGIRYEEYSTKESGNFLGKYYDANGDLIGERSLLPNGYVKGVEVFYYYDPMMVRQILHYADGVNFTSDYYYPNGQAREITTYEPQLSKSFYTPDGKVIGTMEYQLNRGYLKPVNGTEVIFHYGRSRSEIGDKINMLQSYENGQLTQQEYYYENGNIKSRVSYKNNDKELQISFDEDGKELASMAYKNYLPYDGKEISNDKIAVYKNGNLIEEINFYPKMEVPFIKKTDTLETYFDKKGNVIGTLKIDFNNGYAKPLEGKRIGLSYEGEISQIEVFEDGHVKERTSFRKKQVGENDFKTFKRVNFYANDGYTMTREVLFYSNGIKKSDITYKGGYDKLLGTYYNEQGTQLSSFDFIKKEGTMYDFFDESDEIKTIEEYTKGVLQSAKRYDHGTNYNRYGDLNPVLIEDFDINCCATFYTKEGKKIASTVIKNKVPWEGTIYDNSSREIYTVKEGQKNGTYKKFDYNGEVTERGEYKNGLREGLFFFFDYKGNLIKKENYNNDLLEGISIYYDKYGKEISTMKFTQGAPMDGTLILNTNYATNYNQETYKDGKLTERIYFDKKGKTITNFPKENQERTIAYFKDSEIKKLEYTEQDSYLNGEVVWYAKDGKILKKAILEKGSLVSGTLCLNSYYDNKTNYVEVTKEGNLIRALFRNLEDEIVFKAEEKLTIGETMYFLDRLDVKIEYLTKDRLFK